MCDCVNIWKRIIQVRVKTLLTQAKFAKKLDMAQSQLARYEFGNAIPGAKILARMRKVYGVDLNWLVCGDE